MSNNCDKKHHMAQIYKIINLQSSSVHVSTRYSSIFSYTIRHERLLYGKEFDKGTGPIHLGNLRCTGSEETVSECTQPTFSCDHSADVGIRCNGEHLSTPTGNVQLVKRN